jgi:pyrimidine nucleoside transport protein
LKPAIFQKKLNQISIIIISSKMISGWFGTLAGVDDLSFEYILGKVFIPIAFLMGVPSEDTETVATLVGIKTVVNEFAAYQRLGALQKAKEISPRAAVIATYALCGFANPGSIGIQLGGLGAIAPDRKKDLAQVVTRAFVAGCFTSFLNACVAGALISTK